MSYPLKAVAVVAAIALGLLALHLLTQFTDFAFESAVPDWPLEEETGVGLTLTTGSSRSRREVGSFRSPSPGAWPACRGAPFPCLCWRSFSRRSFGEPIAAGERSRPSRRRRGGRGVRPSRFSPSVSP